MVPFGDLGKSKHTPLKPMFFLRFPGGVLRAVTKVRPSAREGSVVINFFSLRLGLRLRLQQGSGLLPRLQEHGRILGIPRGVYLLKFPDFGSRRVYLNKKKGTTCETKGVNSVETNRKANMSRGNYRDSNLSPSGIQKEVHVSCQVEITCSAL